ncbi:hypothetical protein M427DRAFT_54888, partial [Gonapodya prolifera JEL478]
MTTILAIPLLRLFLLSIVAASIVFVAALDILNLPSAISPRKEDNEPRSPVDVDQGPLITSGRLITRQNITCGIAGRASCGTDCVPVPSSITLTCCGTQAQPTCCNANFETCSNGVCVSRTASSWLASPITCTTSMGGGTCGTSGSVFGTPSGVLCSGCPGEGSSTPLDTRWKPAIIQCQRTSTATVNSASSVAGTLAETLSNTNTNTDSTPSQTISPSATSSATSGAAPPPSTESSNTASTAAIAGGVAGGVLGLMLLVGACVLGMRRRRRSSTPSEMNVTDHGVNEPLLYSPHQGGYNFYPAAITPGAFSDSSAPKHNPTVQDEIALFEGNFVELKSVLGMDGEFGEIDRLDLSSGALSDVFTVPTPSPSLAPRLEFKHMSVSSQIMSERKFGEERSSSPCGSQSLSSESTTMAESCTGDGSKSQIDSTRSSAIPLLPSDHFGAVAASGAGNQSN